ncbi:MAG: type 2 isopentenyl-diphosphate Delta-isomerase [Methanomassiliicoccales archaeon]|nr:type 2 isopentenyl-diphosphate Delta-isomerase [Methanomassiliicoccales archaeon]
MNRIERRKSEHVDVTLEEDVSSGKNYWNEVRLVHCSLPEVDLEEVDTSTSLFGRKLAMPLIVTAITGGYQKARTINRNIAEACAELQIGMGVGSQRAGLEKGESSTYSVVKDYDVPLRIANIGAPQLVRQGKKKALGKDDIRQAIDMIDGHLVAVHMNFLQEVAQPEGDTNAKGCLEAIRSLCSEFPVLVKETGAGVSRDVALRLRGIGVRGIDVSGLGGTSFSAVEMFRAQRKGEERFASIGKTYRSWGIPAPVSTIWANVGIPVIASGGIHSGLDVAKGIALGASCGGVARTILSEALVSSKAVKARLEMLALEFKVAMFLTGAKTVDELRGKRFILTGEVRDWVEQIRE